MSGSESYIDRCVEAAASIDAEALCQLEVGSQIGDGGFFAMKTLGNLSVSGTDLSVGLKVPKKHPHYSAAELVELRFAGELESIDLLLTHMPELAEEVPRFMAPVSLDAKDPVALLTEDATSGGEFSIRSANFIGRDRSDLAYSMALAFSAVDGTRVDKELVDSSMQFIVDGNRRLLDFTPPPVCFPGVGDAEEVKDRIWGLIFDRVAVIDVDSESPLGRSLAEHVK